MWKKGIIDVIDGAFVILAKNGLREQLPIGGIACLMLEPGTHISHAAVCLSAQVGTLLVCVGKAGVRLYSSGQPAMTNREWRKNAVRNRQLEQLFDRVKQLEKNG